MSELIETDGLATLLRALTSRTTSQERLLQDIDRDGIRRFDGFHENLPADQLAPIFAARRDLPDTLWSDLDSLVVGLESLGQTRPMTSGIESDVFMYVVFVCNSRITGVISRRIA